MGEVVEEVDYSHQVSQIHYKLVFLN